MGTRGTPTLRVFALVAVAMMVSAVSHAPRSIVGASDPAQAAKLDQDLAALFNKLEPAYRLIDTDKGKIEQAGDRMRVVVNLIRPLGMSLRERGYEALPEVNAAGKLSVDRVIAQLPAGEFDLKMRLDLQYSFAGYASPAGVQRLMAMPEVDSIVPDYIWEINTVEGRQLTHSVDAAAMGYDGTGVGVAILDGGFDYLEAALGGSAPRNGSCPGCYNPVVDYMIDIADSDDDVYPPDCTTGYHGTGTSGIVHRYAPGAKLFMVKVITDGSTSTYTSIMAAGINWCVTNKNIGSVPIQITSMSIGGGKYTGECPTGVFQSAIDNAKAANIVSFQSSGNSGYTDAIGGPACDPDVFAVGSVFDADNANYAPFSPAYCHQGDRYADERICYSNFSNVSHLIHAPSEEVITETSHWCTGSSGPPYYDTLPLGGTSSATPAAAGCTAQILQKRPDLIGKKSDLQKLIQATGGTITNAPNALAPGNKRIDVLGAINFSGAAPGVSSFTATPSTIASGGASTLAWNCTNTAWVTISGLTASAPLATLTRYASSGSMAVSPGWTTTYTLTAEGPGGTATATTTVTVSGAGGGMTISPTTKSFGTVRNGTSSTAQTFAVTNTGTSSLLIGTVYLSGANASEFAIQSDNVSSTSIPPSGVRTFKLVFSPVSDGSKAAQVTVPANAGSASSSLSGTGSATGSTLTGEWTKVRRRGRAHVSGRLTVKNEGAADSGAFQIKIYLSNNPTIGRRDKLIDTIDVSNLAPGARKIVKVAEDDPRDPLFLIGEFNGVEVWHQTPSP